MEKVRVTAQAGKDHPHPSHVTAVKSEEALARSIHELPDEVVILWGKKVTANGPDVISYNLETRTITLWDDKFRSARQRTKPSNTFEADTERLQKSLKAAEAAVRNSRLRQPIRPTHCDHSAKGSIRQRHMAQARHELNLLQQTMNFDPVTDRATLLELMLPLAKQDNLDEAREHRSLYGFGSSMLGTGIECFLLGYFEDGREISTKALSFLRTAVAEKEIPKSYNRGATEKLQLCDFALCEWLVESRNDLNKRTEAVRWKELWFDSLGRTDKTEVQLTLPYYLDAEEYDALFHRYDAAGLKPPKSLRNIRGQGTMSYVLARHRRGLEYSDEEVRAALDSFLKRNVREDWLDRGQYDTVALWMKIAFWQPGDDPIATLLRCYDYLPEFERPKYP